MQQSLFVKRHQGTGLWFLHSDEFQRWINQPTEVLFCPGIKHQVKCILAFLAMDSSGHILTDSPGRSVLSKTQSRRTMLVKKALLHEHTSLETLEVLETQMSSLSLSTKIDHGEFKMLNYIQKMARQSVHISMVLACLIRIRIEERAN